MEIPPPSVPDSRLTDWRQTDRSVDAPFSTPFVSVTTHTCVYEERAQRERIREKTGLDQPWRFFFASRIRLDPLRKPSALLTSLIRRKVTDAFVDRLSERGFDGIRESGTQSVTIGGRKGVQYRYRAQCRLSVDTDGSELLTLPVEGILAIWADDDYHVAGGAYPAGPPAEGLTDVVAVLDEAFDPAAAREELLTLIEGCVDA